MGANDEIDFTCGDLFSALPFLLGSQRTGQQLAADAQRLQQFG